MSEQCGKLRGTIQATGALAGRMFGRCALTGAVAIPQTSGGASTWSELQEKPFETIGDNLNVTGDGALRAIVPPAMERLANSEIEELLK